MNELTIAVGSKDNALEDIHALAKRFVNEPELVIVAGKDARSAIIEHASKPSLPLTLAVFSQSLTLKEVVLKSSRGSSMS